MGTVDRAELSADIFNLSAMLAGVEESGGISRADLARRLGLSRTTASTIIARFIESGLVAEREGDGRQEGRCRPDGRGRPGILLDLATDRWFALGGEYHSGKWLFCITDLKGRIVASHSRQVPDMSPDAFLASLVEGLRETASATPGRLLPAVGIGAPGLVDCARGAIVRADDLGWPAVEVADDVRARYGGEVFVINRNRGSGLAEVRFGAGRGIHSLVYIGIGTGISAAFLSDGALIHGSGWSAGEIGHVVIAADGPRCHCGKRGCLQMVASGSAMAARAAGLIASGRPSELAALPPGELRGEAVCAAAAAGDPVALDCLAEAAAPLGLAVANLITAFNPDKVILGGPVGHAAGPFVGMVRDQAAIHAMDHPFGMVSIEPGSLGEFAGALGAACLVLDHKLGLVLGNR